MHEHGERQPLTLYACGGTARRRIRKSELAAGVVEVAAGIRRPVAHLQASDRRAPAASRSRNVPDLVSPSSTTRSAIAEAAGSRKRAYRPMATATSAASVGEQHARSSRSPAAPRARPGGDRQPRDRRPAQPASAAAARSAASALAPRRPLTSQRHTRLRSPPPRRPARRRRCARAAPPTLCDSRRRPLRRAAREPRATASVDAASAWIASPR